MIEKHITCNFAVESTFDGGTKTASWQPDTYVHPDVLQFIEGLKADPRFAYLHTTAMSDGGHYGSNLNGDIFTEDQLLGMQEPDEALKNPGDMRGVAVPRYKTFEQAKFFRHHDNKPTSPYFGDVALAVWNDLMKRVELIIRIAKFAIPELGMQGAPDIILKLDRNGYISVSMGTRISHEQCNYCGAENQFVSQRCPHLKNMMGRIMPDGTKVAALNFGVRFFDISDVAIPADPVANSIAKVASAEEAGFMPNEAKDVDEGHKAAWMRKRSEMEKHIPTEPTLADTTPYVEDCKCAEKEPVSYTTDELVNAIKVANGDLDTVVSTATLMGITFSPFEMAYLAHEQSKTAGDNWGLDRVDLDKFSHAVYDVLSPKIASRSGYVAPCPAVALWDPVKIAADGHDEVAQYYGYYRACLGALPRETMVKAAHRIPMVRALHEGDMTKVAGALYSLVHAGLDVPL
jgi:hypothetical protein